MKRFLAKGLCATLIMSTLAVVPAQAGFYLHDVDGNGRIDGQDGVLILKAALTGKDDDGKVITDITPYDLDEDGKVTAQDAALAFKEGVTVSILAYRKSSGIGSGYTANIFALKSDSIVDVITDTLNDGAYDEYYDKFLEKAQNKAANTKVRVNGVEYSMFDDIAINKLAEYLSIDGYFDAATFKTIMPRSKDEITKKFVQEFPKKLADCFPDNAKDGKTYGEALAKKIRENNSERGENTGTLTYYDENGNMITVTDAKEVAAMLAEQFAYSTVTVEDVQTVYGDTAMIEYNDFVFIVSVIEN